MIRDKDHLWSSVLHFNYIFIACSHAHLRALVHLIILQRNWRNVLKYSPCSLRWRNFKTQQSPVILDLCLRKTRAGKSHDYREVIVFKKLRFQNVFCLHEYEKPAFLTSSSGLRSVYECGR